MIDNYGLTQTVGPTTEPVTVDEVVAHARLAATTYDATLLSTYIAAAREYYELHTDRQLVTATFSMTLDYFPGRRIDEYRPPGWRYGVIRLPKPPLQSVASFTYIDTDQHAQTLTAVTDYQVSKTREPGRISPAPFKVWPIADPWSMEAVTIVFVAGYGNAAAVPAIAKQAIKMLVAHLHEHREATIEQALQVVPYGLRALIESQGYGEMT